jgi:signal transduction histidine kinase
LSFSADAARSLGRDPVTNPGVTPGSFRRRVVEASGRRYLVSVQTGKANAGDGNETWGLLLDPDALGESLRQLLTMHASPDTNWSVRDADDKVIFASTRGLAGTPAIRARFTDNVPNWSIEIYQMDPPRLTMLLGDRQGVYLYMFLLIAGILVFGLVLTVRTVSHEMELAKMKSDLVSTVSHEFKSPLTSVQQVAEMLQAGRVPSEDRRQQYYDLLVEQSQRLCLLTDNILNLARIEEGRKRLAFERLDVAVLIKDLLPVVQDRVRHEGFVIALELEEPLPEIVADGDALAQALTNLLDNAVKYSGQARSIVVRARIEEGHLVISVKDLGVGITKDEAGHVFDRFYRGGNELTRSVKGSGLGLALVKEIVEAHHGFIRVDSEPGLGSTFSVRLPLR